MSVIVYGPQGCGKTRAAPALAAKYGCRRIVDEWQPGDTLPPETLALTNCPMPGVPGAVAYDEAIGSCGPTELQ